MASELEVGGGREAYNVWQFSTMSLQLSTPRDESLCLLQAVSHAGLPLTSRSSWAHCTFLLVPLLLTFLKPQAL